jgi:hypothetical protein
MLENVRLTHDHLTLEPCQSGTAIADLAPRIAVGGAFPKGANHEVHARGQHLHRGITRCRVELDRLERGAVGKVLGKRTRIRTGIGLQLTDYFLCDHQNDGSVNALNSLAA